MIRNIIDEKLQINNNHLKTSVLLIFKTKLMSTSNSLNYLTNLMFSLELQNTESGPVITYKLTNTIKNKILNYKDTVNSIYVEDKNSFTLNTNPCKCEHSPFIDPHHR